MLAPGSRSSVRKIFKFCQHNGQACIKEAALHTSCIIRLRISWGIQIRKSRHFIITMARLMLLLLMIAPSILTSNAESGQKVIQLIILSFHQDSFSLGSPSWMWCRWFSSLVYPMVYYGLSMLTLRSHGDHRGRKFDWRGVNTMAVEILVLQRCGCMDAWLFSWETPF